MQALGCPGLATVYQLHFPLVKLSKSRPQARAKAAFRVRAESDKQKQSPADLINSTQGEPAAACRHSKQNNEKSTDFVQQTRS